MPSLAPKGSQSTAPYLSYFDDERGAFVIERADGIDSRLFGEGLMPKGTNSVDGAGWSPSGKWFAWTAAEIQLAGNYFTTGSQPFVLNIDGKRRLHALERRYDRIQIS